MFLLHRCTTMQRNVLQANSKLIRLGSFSTKKRLSSMAPAGHTSPRVALPSGPQELSRAARAARTAFRKKEG